MYVLGIFIMNRFKFVTKSNRAGLPGNSSIPRLMLLELLFVLRQVSVLLEGWLDCHACNEVGDCDCMHGCDATKCGTGGNGGGKVHQSIPFI